MVDHAARGPFRVSAGELALVALGGAAGSLARFGVSELLGPAGAWPTATLTVNLVGAFLLGLLLEATAARPGTERARLALGTGLLGGFTTYSLLATQLAEQLLGGAAGLALGYAAATLLGGLAASGVGVWLGHALRARGRAAAGLRGAR